MDALRRTSRTARAASLLSLAALAVHELRYLLAYGDRASEALASQGHAYLSDLGGALITVLLATLLATLLAGALAPPARRPGQAACSAFPRTTALYAFGSDAEDGALSDFVWSVDGEEIVATSALFLHDLALGEHVITLRATTSSGQTAVVSTVVTVTP